MQQFTNKTGISLSLALWLADDDYDHSNEPNTISATTLLKPIRAITLARQNKHLIKIGDIAALIPSRTGTAFHTAIENSWNKQDKIYDILDSLGYPESMYKRIVVNPEPNKDYVFVDEARIDHHISAKDVIPIYMEIRGHKKVGKYTVSGKFDIVVDGQLEDFKSTGTYNWISGSNKEKYMQQGSIYKWLHPKIITNPVMKIQYIFTDWSKMKSLQEKNYPKSRLEEQQLGLMSEQATQAFIENILNQVEKYESAPQKELPRCSRAELWQKPDVYKYYKNPSSKARSTKNFPTMGEAQTRLDADGRVGTIDTYQGEVVRCRFCDVVGVCDQAQQYLKDRLLIL